MTFLNTDNGFHTCNSFSYAMQTSIVEWLYYDVNDLHLKMFNNKLWNIKKFNSWRVATQRVLWISSTQQQA